MIFQDPYASLNPRWIVGDIVGEPLKEQPATAILKTPRCTKDCIEEELFEQRRDLFSTIDLVFFDTTSIYFEGQGGEELGRCWHLA